MKIYLYSFNKKVNSTKQPTGGTEFDANLKAPSSIINPRLEISADCRAFNYCYIPDFSRYYFINDIVYNAGIWILDLSVDVLASYKSAIGSTSSYITRSSVHYDGTIVDNLYPATSECTITNVQANAGYSWTGFNNGYYVLGVQGILENNVNGILYYQLTPAEFVSVLSGFYNNTGANFWGNLAQGVKNFMNKIDDFIVSCCWYPFAFPETGAKHRVFIGSYNTGVDAYRIDEYPNMSLLSSFTVPKHPKASARGSYLNYAPYARYELHDPLVGTIQLNPNIMRDLTTLRKSITPDFTTGEANYRLYTSSQPLGLIPIYETNIPFGCKISLNGSTVSVQALVGNAGAAVMNMAVGDFIGAAAGIGNALLSAIPDMPSHGPNGGFAIFENSTATLKGYFMNIVDADNANRGRPWCQVDTPANVGGYMEIEKPHVSISGTSAEADMINEYLSNGIYYE